MSIAQQVIDHLKQFATVTDVFGVDAACRIYINEAKQGAAMPYAVIKVFDGESHEHLQGFSGVSNARAEITVYGKNSSEAHTGAQAIRFAPLHGFRGTVPGGFFNAVSSGSGYEQGNRPIEKGSKSKRFYCQRDYLISFTEGE